MDYKEILEKLYQRSFLKKKWDLSYVKKLQKQWKYPDKTFLSIHVGGTNGKGSVCYKLASILQKSGYVTGLFISPHISSFQERIQINHRKISKTNVIRYIQPLLAEKELSFFEIITLVAILYFRDQKVDVAIFETGLGGRLDATNIIHPILSIITSISIDHTAYLGKTLEQIAKEKAGIIKYRIPVVLGPSAQRTSILQAAKEKQAPVRLVQGKYSFFDEENQAIAAMALQELNKQFFLPDPVIQKQIKKRPPCRFEIFSHRYLRKHFFHAPQAVVLDVAHNEDGLTKLKKALEKKFPNQKIYVVFGLSKDKELSKCVHVVISFACHIFCTQALSARALEKEKIKKEILRQNFSHVSMKNTIKQTLLEAFEKSYRNGAILVITGSFFIMDAAYSFLEKKQKRDFLDINEKPKPE